MTTISELEEFNVFDRNADRPAKSVDLQSSVGDDPMDLTLGELPSNRKLLDGEKRSSAELGWLGHGELPLVHVRREAKGIPIGKRAFQARFR